VLELFRVTRGAVTLALALLLQGCAQKSDDQKVVATAGEIKVTLAEFQHAHSKITPENRPDISTLEARRDFANDLVNRALLLEQGRKMGGITDPKILDHLDKNLRSRMLGVLYREEIEAKTEVLGQDVAEVHEHRKENVRFSHILLDDVATAQKIREQIVAGKISFEDAAKQHSLDQSTKRLGGAVGEVLWSKNMPVFHRIAFDMEPGAISEPVESDVGVHLVRLDARVPQQLPPLEEARPSLRNEVRNQLEGLRMREFTNELEQRAGLTWNDAGLETLIGLIEAMQKVDVDTIPPERQFVPAADESQRAITLAAFSGRNWTIGDYVDFIAEQPQVNRPPALFPRKGLKEFIRTSQIQTELLYDEAKARGLGERREVLEEDARVREQVLIELVHSRFIQQADVPEEDVRAFYDSTLAATPDAMMLPERVDMLVLVHTDESVVRKGLQRIRSGEPEAAVVEELTLDWRTKSKGGRTGLIARGNYGPQLEDVAFSGRAGKGWSDPVVTESGTGAVKVLVHEPSRVATYDEARDQITSNLAVARGEAAFEEWLQGERSSRRIEIHDEVLELIGQSVT
jgi:parvulin-like peptidyl-prolyl isomerase